MEKRIMAMMPVLNEKQLRRFLASEAKEYGWGGISKVSIISGMSATTIRVGLKELENGEGINDSRIRKVGGGRKRITDKIPNIQEKICRIVDGAAYGNPEKVLSWTTESLRKIQAGLLQKHNINVSYKTVSNILSDMGYSKQVRACSH